MEDVKDELVEKLVPYWVEACKEVESVGVSAFGGYA